MNEERDELENTENYDDNNTSNKNSLTSASLGLLIKKLPLKVKIIIAGVVIGLSLFLLLILCGAAYVSMGDFGKKGSSNLDLNYSSVGDDSALWWPVGSYETTTKNGVTFASGQPSVAYISSGYGPRSAPTSGASTYHRGIDIGSGGKGANYHNVIASLSGKVIKVVTVDPGGGRGCYVKVEHPNGYQTLYQHLHCSSIFVSVGDSIQQGQVLAKMGASGIGTGAHLHFELYINGETVNPAPYISADNPRPVSKKSNYTQGTNEQQSICLTLRNSGFSDDAVAAIMGNMYNESGFNPTATNYLDCRGIVQWCFSRKDNLLATYGSGWSSVDNQLEYFVMEMNGSYNHVTSYLKASHSVEEKTYYFCMRFEVPGESVCSSGKRQSSARGYYSYVQNGCK